MKRLRLYLETGCMAAMALAVIWQGFAIGDRDAFQHRTAVVIVLQLLCLAILLDDGCADDLGTETATRRSSLGIHHHADAISAGQRSSRWTQFLRLTPLERQEIIRRMEGILQ